MMKLAFVKQNYNIIFLVWVNGQAVGNHSGGHLPFEMDISSYLDYTEANRLTVAVNNTLTRYFYVKFYNSNFYDLD